MCRRVSFKRWYIQQIHISGLQGLPVQTLKPGPAFALCTKHFAACHPLSLPLFGCTFKWRLNLFLKTNLKLVSLICLYFIHLSNHHLISISLLRCDNNRRYVGCLIRKQRLHFKLKRTAGELKRFLNEVLDANLQMLMTWIHLMTGIMHSSDDLWWGYFCIGAERLMKWITGRDYRCPSPIFQKVRSSLLTRNPKENSQMRFIHWFHKFAIYYSKHAISRTKLTQKRAYANHILDWVTKFQINELVQSLKSHSRKCTFSHR